MATKPTRADIDAYANTAMRNAGINPPGDTLNGAPLNEHTRDHLQRKYDEARERHLHNAELALNARYEREAAREADAKAEEQQRLDAQVDQLRINYLAMPGATEADFQHALPGLLEAQRREAALTGATEFQRQVVETVQRLGKF